MKKEDFTKLGLTEEQAEKAATASKEELDKKYVSLDRFNEVNGEKNKLKDDVKTRDGQIETFKKDAGASEDLKKQISKLQDDNKTVTDTHQKEMTDVKLTNAIKLTIAGQTYDDDLVAGMFDKSKLILQDDGKVLGLDDQYKNIKESKAFLIKEEDKNNQQKPGFHVGGTPPGSGTGGSGGNGDDKPVSLKDALAARFQTEQN